MVASTFQMLTSTIGTAVAFLLLGASLTFYSYHLLVSALEATHTTSYEELVGKVLGKRMVRANHHPLPPF